MNERNQAPRHTDEWRVEIELENDQHGQSLGERLQGLDLDNEARKRLGGSVIVTRDGPHLFLYAWHEESAQESGEYPWEVVIDVPHVRSTLPLARKLQDEGLPVKRRFRYLLIGADSEDDAVELGKRLEAEVPDEAQVGIRGNPDDMPLPGFVALGNLKPGFLRDLGI